MVSQAFVHIAVSSQESGAFLPITHARDFLLPFSRIVKSPLRRRQHNIRAFRETRVGKKAQANERRSYVTIKNALIPNFADRIAADVSCRATHGLYRTIRDCTKLAALSPHSHICSCICCEESNADFDERIIVLLRNHNDSSYHFSRINKCNE